MSLLHWNQKLSVGVLEMDYQHCELVEMVNDLHDAIKRGRRAEKLKPMVERLIGHTVDHFRDEEEFMQSIGFPGLEEHKRTHEKLVAEVRARYHQFLQGNAGTPQEMLAYLLDWVARHIQDEDMAYGEYAQRQKFVAMC